jgi:hypothetical protein
MRNLKLTLCLLIIVMASKSLGQSKFSFGVNSSYLINNRVFTYQKSDSYNDYRNSNERYKPGFDISTTINYSIKQNFSFETGIGYSENGYMTNEKTIILIDPGFGGYQDLYGYNSYLYSFDYQNIFVPTHFEYNTSKRLNIRLSFGTSFIFPISYKVEYILRKESGSSSGQNVKNVPNENGIKKFNMSVDLGVGMGYKISKNVNLILQPQISYFVFSNENVWARDHLYAYSLFNGQNKSTKENLYSVGLSFKIILTP